MSRLRILSIMVILAIMSVAIPYAIFTQPVAAAVVEFTTEDEDDTYLNEEEPDTEHDETGLRVGQWGADERIRSVLHFFVWWGIDIPDGATIVEATLTLQRYSGSGDPMYLTCQRLKQYFYEEYASWEKYSASYYWDDDGASGSDDYTTSGEDTIYFNGSSWSVEFDVTDIVQWFQTDDDADVLFRVVADSETEDEYVYFCDSEYPGDYAPVLSIQYSYPADARYDPTVTTGSYSEVTNTTASLAGTVTYVDNGLALYEGFEWGNDEDEIGTDGGLIDWHPVGAGTGSNQLHIDTAQHNSGTRSAKFYRDADNVGGWFDYDALDTDETFSFYCRKGADARLSLYHGNGAKLIRMYIYEDEYIKYYDGSYHTPGETVTVNSWNKISITDVDWTAGTYDIYLNDYWVCTADMEVSSLTEDKIYFRNAAGSGSTLWIDDIAWQGYVLERGFQYGLTQTPTWTESEFGLFDTGAYELTIEDLTPATQYWYRAFVMNEEDTEYGSWTAFTTLDAPSISTAAASNVASTSARLNSSLDNDGGDDCTVEFGWGLTSQSHVDDYDNTEILQGTYSSGSNPYLDISSLVAGDTYYFRVKATNDAGTTEGSQLTFETELTLSPPTNMIGYPESESISLAWSKGTGSTNTLLRYGTTTFPATTSTGIYAYLGTGSSYTIEDLESGQTYYISAWGESGGNYSSTYSTIMMTTSATSGTSTDDIDVPTQPSRWFSAPDYTSMDGLLVVYDAINSAADSGHIPRETAWFLLALGLSFIAALVSYLTLGKKLMIAMIVMTVCFAIGYFVRLIPWWVPLMSLILVIAFSQSHKQVAQG